MTTKKLVSLILIMLFLIPSQQGWSQLPGGQLQKPKEPGAKLEEQAQFYLQRISPIQPTPTLPTAAPSKPPSEQPEALTTAPRQVEETSAIEKRAEDHGMTVKQFGYSFFYQPPATFLPVQQVPVGPDYMIGPGDTVRIVIWGSIEGEYSNTVDRNGQINLPKVGVVQVSGLTFKQLRSVLEKEFARQYTNFQMNVTLDNLRTIQVYVVGQARFPGSYAVSSLSTLISALFASGGPSKSGSMRDVQVRRRGRVVRHFDMYDFFIRGDKSKDIRLQSEDVIFIPPIGPLAAIGSPTRGPLIGGGKAGAPGVAKPGAGGAAEAPGVGAGGAGGAKPELKIVGEGAVKVPGIYELKNERTLNDLLTLAGGLADVAFKGRVQVLRVKGRQEMVLFEDDLSRILTRRARDISLVDGDLIKIFPVPELVEKKVLAAGAVKAPGEFGWRDQMRVKDLVDYAGGLLLQANQEEAEITRVTVTPSGPETTRLYVHLRRALQGNPRDNILLKPNDYLFVRTVPEWVLYKTVKIEGQVKFPGTYAIKSGETLSSLLSRAGGFSDKAYPKGAFFTREAVKEMQSKQLQQAINRLEAEMLALSSEKAQTALDEKEAKSREIYVRQQRELLAKLKEVTPLGRVVIHLDDPERLRGTPDDIELQDNDYLIVPPVQQTVNVLGAVSNPTAIIYDPYSTVQGYLDKAGGPTRIADTKSIYVIKVNGSAISGRQRWFGGISSQRLDPGDTIIVPEELERIAWLREIKDVATIIGQIALTAGVVLIGLK
jgi:polysaccharide export outer membrane protein